MAHDTAPVSPARQEAGDGSRWGLDFDATWLTETAKAPNITPLQKEDLLFVAQRLTKIANCLQAAPILAKSAARLVAMLDRKRSRGTVILTNFDAAEIQQALEDAIWAHDALAGPSVSGGQPAPSTRDDFALNQRIAETRRRSEAAIRGKRRTKDGDSIDVAAAPEAERRGFPTTSEVSD